MCSMQLKVLLGLVGVASAELPTPCTAPGCFTTFQASSTPEGSRSFNVADMKGCVPGGTMEMYNPVTKAQQTFSIDDCNTYLGNGYVYTCETSYTRFPFGSQPSEYTQVQFRVPTTGNGVTTLGAVYSPGAPLIQVN